MPHRDPTTVKPRASHALVLVVTLAGFALAGCVGEAPAPPSAPAGAEDGPRDAATPSRSASGGPPGAGDETGPSVAPPWGTPTVLYESCREFHTVYPTPASPFVGMLPPGFTMPTANGVPGTAVVVVFVWSCPAAILSGFGVANETVRVASIVDVASALVVEAPAEHANESVGGDLLELAHFVDAEDAVAHYGDWGVPVTASDAALQVLADQGGLLVERIRVRAGAVTQEITSTVSRDAGPFEGGLSRRWLMGDDGLLGTLLVETSESTQVGLGGALFQASGDPAAPPLAPGISHTVTGSSIRVWFEPLPAGQEA